MPCVTILKIRAAPSPPAVRSAAHRTRTQRRTMDVVGMAFQLGDHLTDGSIPHARRLVLAGRHHAPPSGENAALQSSRNSLPSSSVPEEKNA
jgi:hypothetical protein